MRRTFAILAFLALSCSTHAQCRAEIARYIGTWKHGTNSTPINITLWSDGLAIFSDWNTLQTYGSFTQSLTGARRITISTATNSFIATVSVGGVVRGKFRNFMTQERGRFDCEPTPQVSRVP